MSISGMIDPMFSPIKLLKFTARELMAHLESCYPQLTPSVIQPSHLGWYICLGGNEPLDYILIYKNDADPDNGMTPHWHYVGLGLSDIHNFNSLNMQAASHYPKIVGKDGFGFELTFRLKCNSDESWSQDPPRWPCRVMQTLANYVFQSKILFGIGDHVEYKNPLDEDDESRIRHLLITRDPRLGSLSTSRGSIEFLQLVGVCQEELDIGRQSSVVRLLELMKTNNITGGQLLMTDMRRGETIFELDPEMQDRIENIIEKFGSDMSGMSAQHKYSSSIPKWYKDVEKKDPIVRGYNYEGEFTDNEPSMMCDAVDPCQGFRGPSRISVESESHLKVENFENVPSRFYDNIYLLLELELARVLPVVLRGRLAHQRSFSIQSLKGDLMTTLIPEGCPERSLVSKVNPYVRHGPWLQLFIPTELVAQMTKTIEEQSIESFKNYSWPEFKFHITIVDEIAA